MRSRLLGSSSTGIKQSMSQPWRPSRGSGSSRWTARSQPSSSSAGAGQYPERNPRPQYGNGDSISTQGMRSANLRPLRETPMDLSSPSRGELTPGKSLTNLEVQEEFRRHLEVKVKQYQAEFPDELGVVVSQPVKQKEQLDLILLEFRKLREGIISAKRIDAFAVEVYETSAKLAILARNIPQIATILPHLIRSLHNQGSSTKLQKSSGDLPLDAQIQQLAISGPPSIPADTRARFISYYMLHALLNMEDRSAFQSILRDFVDFDSSQQEAQASTSKVISANKHVTFALDIFRLITTDNYAALAKVVAHPYAYDKFAWIMVRSALSQIQARAWKIMTTSYLSTKDSKWLARMLSLNSTAELEDFLHKVGLPLQILPDINIPLKQKSPAKT